MEQKSIIETDANFNEAMFKTYVDNMFVKIYSAFMFDELPNVKHFMTEEVYQQLQMRQLQLNQQNLRQMYDELNVKSTTIIDFQTTEDSFIIRVQLISRYMDYLVKKDTGDFVSGNNTSRIERINFLTLTKKRTSLTQNAVRKCPGCGASLSVNTKGVCDYCETTYNLEDYNYILSSLTTR